MTPTDDEFERLIAALRQAKAAAPDLRLGQLIAIVALGPGSICPDIALIDDATLVRRLAYFAENGNIAPRS